MVRITYCTSEPMRCYINNPCFDGNKKLLLQVQKVQSKPAPLLLLAPKLGCRQGGKVVLLFAEVCGDYFCVPKLIERAGRPNSSLTG